MQGSLGGVTFRQFRFDSRLHQSSELRKKSLTDRILMALRGLVWVDASANRAATAYTSAPLCNRRLTQKRTLHPPPHAKAHSAPTTPPRRDRRAHSGRATSRKGAFCERASPKGALCMRAVVAPRAHFRRSAYTAASPRLPATAQQCTQVPRNSAERPFSPICVHSCVAA